MKCTPQDQDVHIYIKSVKEMVVYSLASDPINDFFHQGYFASSRDALLKSVRDGTRFSGRYAYLESLPGDRG